MIYKKDAKVPYQLIRNTSSSYSNANFILDIELEENTQGYRFTIDYDIDSEFITNALGLGTFFSGFSIVAAKDNKHILDFLGVNSSDELLSCLVIGYPDVKYKRTVPRKDAVINWM